MDLFYVQEAPQEITWDRKYYTTEEANLAALKTSRTVYVGNLNFKTTELQISEVFSTVGPVKAVIMGVNNKTKVPCGFCFVEYFTTEHAAASLKFLDGSIVDTNIVRIDMDTGFIPGRQYGRGVSGGQRRDEKFKIDYSNRVGGAMPKVSGKKRSTVEKGDSPRGGGAKPAGGAGQDEFGRDLADRLDGGLSAGRAEVPTKRGGGVDETEGGDMQVKVEAEMPLAAVEQEQEVQDAPVLHAEDPRTMEDARDADADEETTQPTKRSRRRD